jgi:hypothetical protein
VHAGDTIVVQIHVARVAVIVIVRVTLIWIVHVDTVVTPVPHAVSGTLVRVQLAHVGGVNAVVARIAHTVSIRIQLIGIGLIHAVVTEVAHTVVVSIVPYAVRATKRMAAISIPKKMVTTMGCARVAEQGLGVVPALVELARVDRARVVIIAVVDSSAGRRRHHGRWRPQPPRRSRAIGRSRC